MKRNEITVWDHKWNIVCVSNIKKQVKQIKESKIRNKTLNHENRINLQHKALIRHVKNKSY